MDWFFSLRYKLRTVWVPIEGAENDFCYNESVYNNSSFETSQLKKKNQFMCFYRDR